MSASYVVMLLVVATGLFFGLDGSDLGGGDAACLAFMPPSPELQPVPRRAALAHRNPQMANAICAARSALRPVLDGDPDPPPSPDGSTLMMFLMLLVIAVSSMLAAACQSPHSRQPLRSRYAALNPLAQLRIITCSRCRLAAEGYFCLLAHRLHSTTLATLEARRKDALIGD
jgi:two-component system cell cycle sensor histidine kinase PleC